MTTTGQTRLYARRPEDKRFAPMDYNRGALVANLMRASIFTRDETAKLRSELADMHAANPGWTFEIRPVGSAL